MNKNCRLYKHHDVYLNKPYIIGYMSVDVVREYKHDLSEMKYVTSIPSGKISFDLNHNIDKAVKRTTDENVEKISLLLKFLLDQKHRLQFLNGVPGPVTVVTYRRTLISIMYSAFNAEKLCIVASSFKNCIYLCSLLTPEELNRKNNSNVDQKKYCAWGYKFEQYMTSDSPDVQPDIDKPVLENAEFSMYYCSQLGSHRLFYGAQIDGMLATSGVNSKPSGSDNVAVNLEYLRNNSFVELKTNKAIQHWKQETSLKKYKMLRCWCQCYLAGLKGLLMGYRNDIGIIQQLQWFNTEDIVNYCQGVWDPQTALNYLNYFLNYVGDTFESLKKTNNNFDHIKPITIQFDIDTHRNIRVSTDIDESNLILPDWYVNAFKE